MNYNITACYKTMNGEVSQSVLCDCENQLEATIAAFKWVMNRVPVWNEIDQAYEMESVAIRDYPINKPSPNGFS